MIYVFDNSFIVFVPIFSSLIIRLINGPPVLNVHFKCYLLHATQLRREIKARSTLQVKEKRSFMQDIIREQFLIKRNLVFTFPARPDTRLQTKWANRTSIPKEHQTFTIFWKNSIIHPWKFLLFHRALSSQESRINRPSSRTSCIWYLLEA